MIPQELVIERAGALFELPFPVGPSAIAMMVGMLAQRCADEAHLERVVNVLMLALKACPVPSQIDEALTDTYEPPAEPVRPVACRRCRDTGTHGGALIEWCQCAVGARVRAAEPGLVDDWNAEMARLFAGIKVGGGC